MIKNTINRAKEDVLIEVVVVVGGLVGGAATEVWTTKSLDLGTLYVACGAGIGGFATLLLVFLFQAPVRSHNEHAEKLNETAKRHEFADILRGIQTELKSIETYKDDPSWLAQARRDLENRQQRVIEALHRPDCQWKRTPNGWSKSDENMISWGALAWVMHHRYPGQIQEPNTLYDTPSETNGLVEIGPRNAPNIKAHAISMIDILIREIEYPDLDPVGEEPPDVYRDIIESYVRLLDYAASSAASPPASPASPPPASPHQS